ncbi:DUF1203 domain-containing protein [Zooshikella ganghwensis]|uniref:DUF1203 domain-containing protein n=1 Tax=Zooshikella ganghwensis TaxID=202772 RepID=A0A4P9VE93_9GAMM|nr:DUF1203 domain-containing protein [Zooshikella ganghwensis]RDH41350.1 DUF1203 domain-containing protein [Zooshikella ganghwensis]RDH41363.1 DUF1203 domain-containing protein [Zooshikella ganghwensis]
MKIDFLILPLDSSLFNSLSHSELEAANAKWLEVDICPGYPCRVSLEDAKVGERVLLLSYTHHKATTPYQSSGPIFVRENAITAETKVNEIPYMLRHRLLSVRGYSNDGTMLEADVTEGDELEKHINGIFQNADVDYIQIHNAKPGCFNCTVVRA